jgi:hypothetical protein
LTFFLEKVKFLSNSACLTVPQSLFDHIRLSGRGTTLWGPLRILLKTHLKTALFLSCMAFSPLRAEVPMPNILDLPTADVVDHYGMDLSFRFYSEGGVLTKTAFGVLPKLNVGFGLDTERFIGTRSVDLNRPTLNMKWRVYDGARSLPALALGYDGQGYYFDEAADEYSQREKGLFLVGSGEIITPGLSLHGGLNVFDFKSDPVYGFAGLHYLHADTVGVFFEADNLFHRGRSSRFNLGGSYSVTPSFSIDLAARDLWAPGRDAERILRIRYQATF